MNPNLVPRPTHPQPFAVYNTDCEIPAPPLASSNYVVVDRGHCNPRFLRTTVNVMPATPDVLERAKVPIVAITAPLAAVGPGEESVRAVDFGPDGPLRCSRCRAYINPYCQFIDNGQKFEVGWAVEQRWVWGPVAGGCAGSLHSDVYCAPAAASLRAQCRVLAA